MADNCTVCGSDWIFKAPKGLHHLCEECYNQMSKEVTDYHDIQKEAHKYVLNGKVDDAINLLHLVQVKRNEIHKYFNNTLNAGHYWFANEFIPTLIEELTINKNTNPKAIWNAAFTALETTE